MLFFFATKNYLSKLNSKLFEIFFNKSTLEARRKIKNSNKVVKKIQSLRDFL